MLPSFVNHVVILQMKSGVASTYPSQALLETTLESLHKKVYCYGEAEALNMMIVVSLMLLSHGSCPRRLLCLVRTSDPVQRNEIFDHDYPHSQGMSVCRARIHDHVYSITADPIVASDLARNSS